jgi:HlyD family secretion protein
MIAASPRSEKEGSMDRIIRKKKWTVKRVAWMSAAALFLILVLRLVVFADHSSKLNVQADRITVSAVHKGEFQEFITVTGTIIPVSTIYLDAMEGGRVETIFLEAGSYVNKGDSILKLSNTDLLLDIMYREAELFQQSNNLRNTRLLMEQNRLSLSADLMELDYQISQQKRVCATDDQLKKNDLISEQEYEAARDQYNYLTKKRELTLQSHQQDSVFRDTQIRQLELSLDRMDANLEIVKQNLENLIIRAPVSGQLTSLNAEIGESKNRGERLGQIDVLDGFKVRASIDEYYIVRISMGLKGEFTLNNQIYHLVIRKVYPEVLNGRFEVDMEFTDREPEGIRRGQTLHIRLELGDLSEALLLDRGGFYQTTGGRWVYVIDQSGDVAVKRNVSLGRQNPDVFEILDGLEEGENVITSSYDNYGDKDKLILKK